MKKTNRLIHEKSPYLLQHAYNPVDWYPWSEEAFEKAKREEKPIFLSIGYSTCHWCHVMERESFEDEEVARVLNRDFVAIKVDREERPDVDHVYMTVCQAMTGQGGWPLTVLMTPEKKPFFAGTYFPKRSKYGRTGLLEILERVADAWKRKRTDLLQAGNRVTEAIRGNMDPAVRGELSEEMLTGAYEQLSDQFDERYGGFGQSPKFPRPHDFLFLLRHWKRTGEERALQMVEKTLEAMRRGGIYDHVGFGFSRYSVDDRWHTPHFEKMLYDNALLAVAYLEAYQVTGKEAYARVAREIFTYVLRDMTSPEGGFYSAEDADSEGEEGKFYLWTPEEIREVLGAGMGRLFCECYGVTDAGNFEGKNILHQIGISLSAVAVRHGMGMDELEQKLEEARRKLFQAREQRVRPHRDDKILTSWNALMIVALSRGARVLGERRYADAAEGAARFILKTLRRGDGRLLARYRDGEAAIPAFLDDYAFLAWGLIELYEATLRVEYLRRAADLAREMLDLFGDDRGGGAVFLRQRRGGAAHPSQGVVRRSHPFRQFGGGVHAASAFPDTGRSRAGKGGGTATCGLCCHRPADADGLYVLFDGGAVRPGSDPGDCRGRPAQPCGYPADAGDGRKGLFAGCGMGIPAGRRAGAGSGGAHPLCSGASGSGRQSRRLCVRKLCLP